ncbi:MAG: DUF6789 family protein [Chthoniobacterales bacterium]
MPEFLSPLFAGIVGTALMTAFLLIPRWLKIANVDIIRAVGALVTKREDNAWKPGMAIHLFSGIVFGYIYWAALSLAGLPLNIWTGIVLGAVHGAIVMLLTGIAVMEHHPMRKYQDRGPMTGFMQLLAHVIYGGTVGLIIQILTPSI